MVILQSLGHKKQFKPSLFDKIFNIQIQTRIIPSICALCVLSNKNVYYDTILHNWENIFLNCYSSDSIANSPT